MLATRIKNQRTLINTTAIWWVLALFIVPPLFGLATLWLGDIPGAYTVSSGGVLLAYSVHVILVFFFAAVTTTSLSRKFAKFKQLIIILPHTWRANYYVSVWVILFSFLMVLFVFGGINVVLNAVDRGEFRVSMGWMGFAFTWFAQYLLPALSALMSYQYCKLENPGRWDALRLASIYFSIILIIMLLGAKGAAIRTVLPGFLVLAIVKGKTFSLILVIVVLGFVFGVGAAMYFEHRPFDEAVVYLLYRATAVSAYGVVAAWQTFPDGVGIIEYSKSLILIFGASIVSELTGVSKASEAFLSYDIPRLLTYLTYPDTDAAIAGTVNLTITAFGEGIYAFGYKGFWIFSAFGGLLTGFVAFLLRKALLKGDGVWVALYSVYFIFPICAWQNSGGISSIVGLPVLVGFVALWLFLSVMFSNRRQRLA